MIPNYCCILIAVTETGSCNGNQLERKGCSGALLDMLAEVASQTLHSDPSVKVSPIKRTAKKTADISCHFSDNKKVSNLIIFILKWFCHLLIVPETEWF